MAYPETAPLVKNDTDVWNKSLLFYCVKFICFMYSKSWFPHSVYWFVHDLSILLSWQFRQQCTASFILFLWLLTALYTAPLVAVFLLKPMIPMIGDRDRFYGSVRFLFWKDNPRIECEMKYWTECEGWAFLQIRPSFSKVCCLLIISSAQMSGRLL